MQSLCFQSFLDCFWDSKRCQHYDCGCDPIPLENDKERNVCMFGSDPVTPWHVAARSYLCVKYFPPAIGWLYGWERTHCLSRSGTLEWRWTASLYHTVHPGLVQGQKMCAMAQNLHWGDSSEPGWAGCQLLGASAQLPVGHDRRKPPLISFQSLE
jgi:hypothetical protein